MYYLIPHRFAISRPDATASVAVLLDQWANDERISLRREATYAIIVRKSESSEWLAPEIALSEEGAHKVTLSMRPRRWLRRLLRLEIALLLSTAIGLAIVGQYQPMTLILGLVILNHTTIYILMRQRFRATRSWLEDIFAAS